MTFRQLGYILLAMTERIAPGEIDFKQQIVKLDCATRGGGLLFEKSGDFGDFGLYCRKPAQVLAKFFGYDEKNFHDQLRQEGRIYPIWLCLKEFPDEGVVKVGIGHSFSNTYSVIQYRPKTSEIQTLSRENLYLEGVSGSFWREHDYENLTRQDSTRRLANAILSRKQALDNKEGRLIIYKFHPYFGRARNFEEGTANIVYYWDLKEGRWIYMAHAVGDWGEDPKRKDKYYVAARSGQKIPLVIQPFGTYEIPKVVKVADLIHGMIFPRVVEVPSLDPRGKRRADVSVPELEFIGIEKYGGWN